MASVKDRLAARRASERGGKSKSLSKSSVQKVMSAAQSARDKSVKDASFSDLAKLEKQTQVKYDRGADLQKYIDKQAMYQDAISKGATTFVGPDGIERLNLAGTGITTPEGATVLSMFKPGITAIAPTGKQLMGDIGRSLFSGYNTLSYDPNAVGTPSTTGGTISRVPGLVPNIVNKYITGDLGIVGLAKNLYNKFTKTAADAKNFLGAKINQLSDIDLERYLNKKDYKLTSQSPELQEIYQLEADEASARNTRDILGTRINEAISYGPSVTTSSEIESQTIKPIIPSTLYGMPQQPPGFKVIPPEQKALLEEMNKADALNSGGINNIQIQNGQGSVITDQQMNDAINKSNEIFGNDSIFGTSSTYNPNKGYLQQYADASKKDIKTIAPFRNAGMSYGDVMNNFGSVIDDLKQKNPSLTDDDIKGILDGTITQPTGQYAANGGMIEKRLGDIQKKTNTMYGTGILSVR